MGSCVVMPVVADLLARGIGDDGFNSESSDTPMTTGRVGGCGAAGGDDAGSDGVSGRAQGMPVRPRGWRVSKVWEAASGWGGQRYRKREQQRPTAGRAWRWRVGVGVVGEKEGGEARARARARARGGEW